MTAPVTQLAAVRRQLPAERFPHLIKLLRVESPHAFRPVVMQIPAETCREIVEDLILRARQTREKKRFPGFTPLLLAGAHIALCLLDLALLPHHRAEIVVLNGFADTGPGAARLPRVLVFEWSNFDLCRRVLEVVEVVLFHRLPGAAVLDGPARAPRSVDLVECFLRARFVVETRGEAVLRAPGQPGPSELDF